MIKFIKKLLGTKVRQLPPKDPKDFTKTRSSTSWVAQQYWCTACKSNRSYWEYMSDVCESCGGYNQMDLYGCTIRKIWNGEKWMYQYKERGNKSWLGEIK